MIKSLAISLVILVGSAGRLGAQARPQVAELLRSSNWIDRMEAYQHLSGQERSAEGNRQLASLLLKEDEITRAAFLEGNGASSKYGESYSEYVAYLAGTVMEIVGREPGRTDVWPALLNAPYNPESKFGSFLASHGDKTANFMLASAEGKDVHLRPADAIVVLAEIVNFERDGSTKHRLSEQDVDALDREIRARLDDPDEGVRYSAIKGLALIGTVEDLATLERIALTDPRVTTAGGPTGAEIRFFNREAAHEAVERLRKRLDAKTNAKQ